MRKFKSPFLIPFIALFFSSAINAQHHHTTSANAMPVVADAEAQPLFAHVTRLNEALTFLGSSLSPEDSKHLRELEHMHHGPELVKAIQEILDPYCLAMININPEARVKVARGPAKAKLMQEGWTSFLVKVQNDAGITPKLNIESPNSDPAFFISSGDHQAKPENKLTRGQVDNRFLEMSIYRNRPLMENLSGMKVEYAVLQIYSKDAGKREAELAFNVGQGTQDIGFRNSIHILFDIHPSVKVVFRVKDDDGSPTMASFTIKDGIERVLRPDSAYPYVTADYRISKAQTVYNTSEKGLTGIYPLPSRRVAAYDEFPDFFFQAQVYRADGEFVRLAPGKYDVTFTRGPEYTMQTKQIVIPANVDSFEASFKLKRWIHMSKLGWYSADHHVHAAGCSHYESPEEGVPPMHMWRQLLGEDLNIGAVLTWGPSWYHQKSFFTGDVSSFSTKNNIMRYDVEVSGFPSSHAGHVVLLRLKEDDYPGTKTVEQWPSWTLPILKWAKSQGAVVGYAHSGLGLEPIKPTFEIPNYEIPKMDDIGANEYIVTVVHNAVDFFSAGDTPAPWELNMWYHTLNCGFRTRLSGETDFPCMYDERVGVARSYFKSDSVLNFTNYTDAILTQKSYVSDGGSHIIDISVNGANNINAKSEVLLNKPQTVDITAKVVANLPVSQDEASADIAHRSLDQQPYWSIQRARIGTSRKVPVELIVNGIPVDKIEIDADGSWKDVHFKYKLDKSSWAAIRVYPSSHTNPVFMIVNEKPIAVKKSAEWCVAALDQCWKMKESRIRAEEKTEAKDAYDKARVVYEKIIKDASN